MLVCEWCDWYRSAEDWGHRLQGTPYEGMGSYIFELVWSLFGSGACLLTISALI